MFENMGVWFALVALVGWACGDFFIQRSTRVIGWYKTLFVIGMFGALGLLPFVVHELAAHSLNDVYTLLYVSLIILVYAWAIFEALRLGKISVVEAVVAIELPLTVSLGVFVGGEILTVQQVLLFIFTFVGILLVAVKRLDFIGHWRRIIEKGVMLAFVGSFFSALTNFYIGTYAESLSPLFVIWFTHTTLALLCGGYMFVRREFGPFWKDVMRDPAPIAASGIFDNVAWVGYALATSVIPISLTVTISESYIALAAILGYLFAGERLKRHQVLGVIITFVSAGILSMTL
jgi:drug/metabolite transporter (DMT)-like permease